MTSPAGMLHLSGEVKDSLNRGRNSPVVQRLVDALSDGSPQWVVSINRTSDPRRACAVEESPAHLALRYFAPPYGLGHLFFLDSLADRIGDWLTARAIRPALVMAHKFTIEGVLAERLASRLGCGYVLGFMNTTDEKLWRALPWCRSRFERVAAGAQAWVFPTPMTEQRFMRRLAARPHRVRVIPYISDIPTVPPQPHGIADPLALLTVFNFQMLRYKNFDRLVQAVMQLRGAGLAVTLDVVGGGEAAEVARVQQVLQHHAAGAAVRCIGHVAPADMRGTMARYAGMALPSFPESFGLVYLEALAAGTPVLSSRGYALDGFFSGGFPGVKVDPRSVASIATGIRALVEQRAGLTAAFGAMGPEWQRFTRHHIRAAYLQLMEEIDHAH
jgi:glycosyltransferase involved in cell wall biosynthesis